MKYLIIMLLLIPQVKADVIFKNNFELICSPSMYPGNLRAVKTTYKSINDGFGFNESSSTSFLLNINNTEFYTLSGFTFSETDARRRIVFIDAPSNVHLMAQGTMSISVCPGDFSSTAQCVMPVNNNTTLLFSTKSGDSQPNFCKLDPNTVYYANYVNSPDPENVAPSCANTEHTKCAMFYTEAALN